MDEAFIKQIIAELRDQQGTALAIVVSALAQQLDPARLATDLRQYIQAAKATGALHSTGETIVLSAMAAADAEAALQQPARH